MRYVFTSVIDLFVN